MSELERYQRIIGNGYSLVVQRIDKIIFTNKENNIDIRVCFTVLYKEDGKNKDYEIALIVEKTKKGTIKVDINRPCLVPNYIQHEVVRAVYNQYFHQVNDKFKTGKAGQQMSLFG